MDVKDIALKNKIGTEEAGRIARYKIFESLMKKDTEKIATAHTLSDRCETFIFNLLRGASLKGLCSIPPVREKIIRPLDRKLKNIAWIMVLIIFMTVRILKKIIQEIK